MTRPVKIAHPTQVTFGRASHEHPVFSPDGRSIAFYGGTYGALQIHLVGVDGEGQRPLTCAKGNHTQPAFSADGRHVYFRHQAANDAPWRLERVLVEDPSVRELVLAHRRTSFKHPSPSPDGRTLAWFSDAGSPQRFRLFSARLLPARGGATRLGAHERLTNEDDRNDCHPTWSPDSRSLVFHAYLGAVDAAESHIFRCRADGVEVRRLTVEPGYHKHPFFVGADRIVHHTQVGDGRRRLVLRSADDGGLVGDLTSGKRSDKHPCPYVPARGPTRIAFASKRRGIEIPGQTDESYDVFVGTLEGARIRR